MLQLQPRKTLPTQWYFSSQTPVEDDRIFTYFYCTRNSLATKASPASGGRNIGHEIGK